MRSPGELVRRYVSGRPRAEVVRRLDALRRDAADGTFASDESTVEYLGRWLIGAKARLRPYAERVRRPAHQWSTTRPSSSHQR